jgi:hypothetical protein
MLPFAISAMRNPSTSERLAIVAVGARARPLAPGSDIDLLSAPYKQTAWATSPSSFFTSGQISVSKWAPTRIDDTIRRRAVTTFSRSSRKAVSMQRCPAVRRNGGPLPQEVVAEVKEF